MKVTPGSQAAFQAFLRQPYLSPNYVYENGWSNCVYDLSNLDDGFSYIHILKTGWRHQMETFSALLALCAGNSPVNGEFPAQRPVTRIFDVFFDLRLIKRLSKHSRGWWFETLSHPLWRHRNDMHLAETSLSEAGFWGMDKQLYEHSNLSML